MKINEWPEEVVLQAQERNLILVVGAGVSKNSTNDLKEAPPTWSELLYKIKNSVSMDVSQDELEYLDDLIKKKENLLEAAEFIMHHAGSKRQDVYRIIQQSFEGAGDPLARTSKGKLFRGNRWHSALAKFESKIIITTNFDKIIERATDSGYKVHRFESKKAASDVRRGEPVLLKIHGCVDDIENIILTRSDYTRVRREGACMFELLHALLLTRPALFIGYGLGDPDLQLVLENVLGARDELPPHYILTPSGPKVPKYKREILDYCYGLNPIIYKSDCGHSEALRMFEELAETVESTPPEGCRF